MTPTPHGQVPAIQRYKIGYYSDEWGVRSSTPTGIYDDAGPWVRYEDHAAAIAALRAQQPAPATQQPCPTCAALARTVMMDQVSFDRKPDCYGIRQITDDEGVEEWEDIRTSPDVAREEANDMMATGRGEIYEVVPLWTTPQPVPATQQAGWKLVPMVPTAAMVDAGCPVGEMVDHFDMATAYRSMLAAAPQHSPTAQAAPAATPQADSQPAPVLDYPPLPRVGAIGYASVVDIQSYAKTLTIGPHLPGVRDIALWTTDQMRAYVDADRAARKEGGA